MDPRYKSPDSNVVQIETDGFRDLQAHTTLLVWLLRLSAVMAVVAIWASWMQLELLGRHYTLQEAQANDLRERGAVGVAFLVSIACYVVFGRWIVLAHRNLPPLGLRYPDFTPGGAVGWFFVPVANLWKPYQAMRLLYKASRESGDWKEQDDPPLLITWWSLWIVAALIGSYILASSSRGNTIPELIDSTRGLLFVYAIRVPQHVVAWLMVQKIWNAQAAQRERQSAAPA